MAGIFAVGIYILILALFLYYFGYRHERRLVHFVDKNRKGIAVTLASSPLSGNHKPPVKKVSKARKHSKPRKLHSQKPRIRKISAKKALSRKKPDTKRLFGKVKLAKKKTSSLKTSKQDPMEKRGESLKKSSRDSGVENAYLARVESLLRGWPAQANFAGEEIDIYLKIYQNGMFEYKILKLSSNPDFNHQLLAYLKQLQRGGFGMHQRTKPYEIEVHFIAHE